MDGYVHKRLSDIMGGILVECKQAGAVIASSVHKVTRESLLKEAYMTLENRPAFLRNGAPLGERSHLVLTSKGLSWIETETART